MSSVPEWVNEGLDHRFTTIICTHCGHEFCVPVYCGNRFCSTCSRPRLARVRRRIDYLVKNTERKPAYDFRHLTLTIRSQRDLPGMLRSISRSFRRLRQTGLWKRHVSGGAFVLEVTRKDDYFHAHIHCVIYSRFIDWHKLLPLWVKCSTGRGVYITLIPQHKIVGYLTKYLSKPCPTTEIAEDVHSALAGIRLFTPFGSWHALSGKYVEEKPVCRKCGYRAFLPLDILYTKTRVSDVYALPP